MTRSFENWTQVGDAVRLPVSPSTSDDGCFPRFASHEYMPDPHKPGTMICRNCADRTAITQKAIA